MAFPFIWIIKYNVKLVHNSLILLRVNLIPKQHHSHQRLYALTLHHPTFSNKIICVPQTTTHRSKCFQTFYKQVFAVNLFYAKSIATFSALPCSFFTLLLFQQALDGFIWLKFTLVIKSKLFQKFIQFFLLGAITFNFSSKENSNNFEYKISSTDRTGDWEEAASFIVFKLKCTKVFDKIYPNAMA